MKKIIKEAKNKRIKLGKFMLVNGKRSAYFNSLTKKDFPGMINPHANVEMNNGKKIAIYHYSQNKPGTAYKGWVYNIEMAKVVAKKDRDMGFIFVFDGDSLPEQALEICCETIYNRRHMHFVNAKHLSEKEMNAQIKAQIKKFHLS